MDKTQGFLDLLPQAEYLEHHLNGLGWHKIIACKDCKYYTGYECQRSKVSNIRVITDENDYCSRAEKRE